MEGNGGGGVGGGTVARNVNASSQFQDRLVQALNNKETENRGLKVQVQNLQENLNGRNNCLQYLDSGINQLIDTLKLTSSQVESGGGDGGGGGSGGESSGVGGGSGGGGGGGENNGQSVDFSTMLNIPGDLFEEMAQQHFQNKLGDLSTLFWGTVEGLSLKLEKTEKDLKKARDQIGSLGRLMGTVETNRVRDKMRGGFRGSVAVGSGSGSSRAVVAPVPPPVVDSSGIGLNSNRSGGDGDGMEDEEETVDLNQDDQLERGVGGGQGGSFEEEEETVGAGRETGGSGMGPPVLPAQVGGGNPFLEGFRQGVVVKVEPGTFPLDGYRDRVSTGPPRRCKVVKHARDWSHRGLRIHCLCGTLFLTKKAFERHLSRNALGRKLRGRMEEEEGGDQGQGQGVGSGENGGGGGGEREEMPTSSAERVKVDGRRRQMIDNFGGRRVSTSPERRHRRKRGPYMTKMTRTKRKSVGAGGSGGAAGGPQVPDSTSQLVVGNVQVGSPGPGPAPGPSKKRGRKPNKVKEVRFSCDICRQLFKSVSLVKNHKLNAHNVRDEVFKIGCKDCGTIFLKRDDFAKHRMNEHGTQYGSSKNRRSESPRKQESSPEEPKPKRRRRSRKQAAEEEEEEEEVAAPSGIENGEEEGEGSGDGEELEETLLEENDETVANDEEEEEEDAATANVNGDHEEVEETGVDDEVSPPEEGVLNGEVRGEETLGGTRANSNGNSSDLLRFACTVCKEEFRSRGCLQLHMGQKHTAGMPKLKRKGLLRKSGGGSGENSPKVAGKKVSFNLPPMPELAGSTFEEEGEEEEAGGEEMGEDSKEGVMETVEQQQVIGGDGGEVGTPMSGEGTNAGGLSPEPGTSHYVATIPLGGQAAPGGASSPAVVVKTETEEQQAEAAAE